MGLKKISYFFVQKNFSNEISVTFSICDTKFSLACQGQTPLLKFSCILLISVHFYKNPESALIIYMHELCM